MQYWYQGLFVFYDVITVETINHDVVVAGTSDGNICVFHGRMDCSIVTHVQVPATGFYSASKCDADWGQPLA